MRSTTTVFLGLALATIALLAPARGATVTVTQGTDLIMGFRATSGQGAPINLEVNLGAISRYTNPASSSFTVTALTKADLDATYGASWNTRTDLFWGIAGYTGGVNKTVYASRAEATAGTQSAPYARDLQNALNAAGSAIQTAINGFNGQTATSNSSAAAQVSAASGDSWTGASNPDSGTSFVKFDTAGVFENVTTVASGFYLVSDLYKIQAGSGDAVYVGSFGLNSSGVLTFSTSPGVFATNTAPVIAAQPVDQTAIVGGSATFSVTATGTPAPSYRWRRNSVDLTDGSSVSGAGTATLSLTNIQSGDAGSYTVVVSNGVGSPATSTAAVLTVLVPPTFTTQPVGQTVNPGDTVTFTGVAAGSPAPTLQWRKNGLDLAGATTGTLTLTNVQAAAAGTYTLAATNTGGTSVSNAAVLSVNTPPTITTAPSGKAAFYGDTFSLTVVASGTAPFSYQWRKDSVNLSNTGAVTGATTATLTLTGVTYADAGSYDVVVSNGANPNATSAAAVVTVSPVPVSITVQPVNQTASDGGAATFGVTATGTAPLTYQWQRGGVNLAGATSASLVLSNLTLADSGGAYTVTVTNLAGSVVSDVAVLTVNPVAPTITSQPANRTVSDGASTTFTVGAAGTAPLSYQWKKDGVNIAGANTATLSLSNVGVALSGSVYTVVVSNSAGSATSGGATLTVNAIAPAITTPPSAQSIVDGGATTFSVVASGTAPLSYQWRKDGNAIAGATTASLALTNVPFADSGAVYTVVVSNAGGSVTSAGALLTVNAAAPTIVAHPANQGGRVGDTLTLTVTAAGTAPLNYQWKKGTSTISGATSATLTLANVQTSAAGDYSVVVSNSAGSVTSNPATVDVALADAAPTITSQPVSQTANAGSTVTLSVGAAGVPTPSYQWRKGGAPIPGATSASLVFTNVQAADAGTYSVYVANSLGNVTSQDVTLAVNVGPTFTLQPVDQTVNRGEAATFTVAVAGTPTPSITWSKNGIAIAGASGTTLQLVNVQSADAGNYTATATNGAGTTTSQSAALTVNTAPVFTLQPTSQTVNRGLNVTFSAAAAGQPTPTYQWRRDGLPISGATESTLTLANVQSSDAAAYSVVATNSAGSVTSSDATLSVNAAAAILTQPISQTVLVGDRVTFTVVASGVPAPTYQWRKGGVAISGATAASLTLTNVQLADAGGYSVNVVNTLGAVTSTTAVLTVNSLPAITTQPVSQTVDAGATVTLTVVATGSPTPTYQWRKDGSPLAGATEATLNLSNVTSESAGAYTVVVTNAAGSVTSVAATLAVRATPVFDVQPTSQSSSLGATVTFTASTSVVPVPTYQWQVSTDGGVKWTNLFNGGVYSGVTTSVLTIAGITSNLDNYQYRNVATNALGSAISAAATLITNKQPATVQLSGLTTVFNDSRQSAIATTVPAGLSVSITYNGSGTPPYDAGTYTVVATINDAVYGGSTSATMIIAPMTPTVTWNTPGPLAFNYLLSGRELNATASVPGRFVYQPDVGTHLSLGSHTLYATFLPTASRNYATVQTSTTLLVVKGKLTATANNQVRLYGVDNPPLTVTYTGFAGTETKAVLSSEPVATTTATKDSPPGTYPITLTGGYANDYDLVLENGTLTITGRDYSGYYFGSLPGGGSWALRLRTDGTGTYVAYFPLRHSALVTQVAFDTTGSFTAAGSELVPQSVAAGLGGAAALSLAGDSAAGTAVAVGGTLTLSGKVANGIVTAQIPELDLALSGTLDGATGAVATLAGVYTASTLESAGGSTYSIVGPSGRAVVVVSTPSFVTGATGMVASNGEFGATSAEGTQVAAAYSATSQSMAALVTPAGSTTPITFNGSAESVAQTAHLVNLSVRTTAGVGDKTLIVGFVVSGTGAKPLLLRAIGPSLSQFGLAGTLFDPSLTVNTGSATPALVSSNDDWDPSVRTISAQLGAFALASGSLDAVSYNSTRFTSGPYTMQVTDRVGTSGLALAEVYDALPNSRTARLVNLSARAQVENGDGVLIAGFVVNGSGSIKVLLRGIGPTLSQFGVKGALGDPKLALYQSVNGLSTLLATNDDWSNSAPMKTSFTATGAFALPQSSKDAALLLTLTAGVYSVQVSGVNSATGVALVEVYEVP